MALGSPRGSSTGALLHGETGPCLGRRRREAAGPPPVAPWLMARAPQHVHSSTIGHCRKSGPLRAQQAVTWTLNFPVTASQMASRPPMVKVGRGGAWKGLREHEMQGKWPSGVAPLA